MRGKQLTYASSGVSVSKGDRFVDAIAPIAAQSIRPEIKESIGGFAAISALPRKVRNPLLVVSTDGVGTKVLLASEANKLNTVGMDLVAMSVNDILTLGAEPFLFLDYFAVGRLDVRRGKEIVKGIVQGCKEAGCALVGGETAEMPQVYRGTDFDLAGFCVGVVDGKKIVDGRNVISGDVLIGLPSSGVHSNGYSLIRSILRRRNISTRKAPILELLRPTRIYVRPVLRALDKISIHAMAHITGGGLEGNVPRSFRRGLVAVVEIGSWNIPEIFHWIQDSGGLSDKEMYRTFNMGIGYVLVVPEKEVALALKMFKGAKRIGFVEKGRGEARLDFT